MRAGSLLMLLGLVGCFPSVDLTGRECDDTHSCAEGFFCRGRAGQSGLAGVQQVRLNGVHALQLISEYVRGNKSSFYSYELNLVLDDGSRVNVVDHGALARLRDDARTLARFLGRPLWDATR